MCGDEILKLLARWLELIARYVLETQPGDCYRVFVYVEGGMEASSASLLKTFHQ